MLDHAYNIGVCDIEYRSYGARVRCRAGMPPAWAGSVFGDVDAHGDAWIADVDFVNELNDSVGVAVK
jgi:hypothetical protein